MDKNREEKIVLDELTDEIFNVIDKYRDDINSYVFICVLENIKYQLLIEVNQNSFIDNFNLDS